MEFPFMSDVKVEKPGAVMKKSSTLRELEKQFPEVKNKELMSKLVELRRFIAEKMKEIGPDATQDMQEVKDLMKEMDAVVEDTQNDLLDYRHVTVPKKMVMEIGETMDQAKVDVENCLKAGKVV